MDWTGYEFTADWFSHHIPVWDNLLAQKQPCWIVEVGSYEGRSACYLIEKCADQRPLTLWCIDTWEGGVDNNPDVMGDVERRFDRNVAVAIGRAKHPVAIHKLRSPSNIALAEVLVAERRGAIDLIYVDGSHQAPDVLSDAVIAFSLLKVGGLMIFDDYLWQLEPLQKRDPLNMPKVAIDAFLNIFMRKMVIIAGAPNRQVYALKVAE